MLSQLPSPLPWSQWAMGHPSTDRGAAGLGHRVPGSKANLALGDTNHAGGTWTGYGSGGNGRRGMLGCSCCRVGPLGGVNGARSLWMLGLWGPGRHQHRAVWLLSISGDGPIPFPRLLPSIGDFSSWKRILVPIRSRCPGLVGTCSHRQWHQAGPRLSEDEPEMGLEGAWVIPGVRDWELESLLYLVLGPQHPTAELAWLGRSLTLNPTDAQQLGPRCCPSEQLGRKEGQCER